VDVWLADLRVSQLLNALINPTSRNNLQIMKGNKIVEVKSANFNKGTEAVRLISQDNYDFVMAIGDDTTDEEMFMALPEEAITIKVGKNSSIAQYNLPTQQQTLIFLNNLMQ
jgi:trehalose 6-phosphate synthase/phosphatase